MSDLASSEKETPAEVPAPTGPTETAQGATLGAEPNIAPRPNGAHGMA